MALKLEHISFGFLKGNLLLDDLSFELEKGKVYALMGANGAGKTTLFNLITGFLKPQSGTISLSGNKINGLSPYLINRKGISRTFQDLRLVTKLTVKENIILAMRNNPTDKWFNALLPGFVYKDSSFNLELIAERLIVNYFLQDVLDSPAGEISYGQQKLLNLACCAANDAAVLLLDEPVAGINPAYRDKIVTIIKLLKDKGKTIFMIEHNTEFIDEVADSIFFLANGQIAKYTDINTMKADPKVLDAYM